MLVPESVHANGICDRWDKHTLRCDDLAGNLETHGFGVDFFDYKVTSEAVELPPVAVDAFTNW